MKKMTVMIGIIVVVAICVILIALCKPSGKQPNGVDNVTTQKMQNDNETLDSETKDSKTQDSETQDSEQRPSETLLDFEVIEIRNRGTVAGDDVCKVTKTENGVLLQHYHTVSYWDNELGEEKENITPISETEGDEDLLRDVQRIVGAYDITKWDGFDESDPNVLDGSMFFFYAKLADGSEINAHGTNAYPDRFNEFQRSIRNLMN